MGNTDTKLSYRKAVLELTGRSGQPIEASDEEFWSQFWHDNHIETIQDVFAVLSAQEIRALRDQSPSNLATLCYKAVEQLVKVTDTLCNTASQQKTVLTCVALLTRVLPYIFEEADWRSFFWTNVPSPASSVASSLDQSCSDLRFRGTHHRHHHHNQLHSANLSRSASTGANLTDTDTVDLLSHMPLAQSLLLSLADLLFCPDFTVAPLDSKGTKFGAPDTPPEDLQSIDSCEYIWEAGVGCSLAASASPVYDHNRTELLRLLLTCFSESMFCSNHEAAHQPNQWIEFFTCNENRHALPLFTSLLNTVFAYNPNSLLPFNHLLFSDSKEPLVEVALQILIVALDHDFTHSAMSDQPTTSTVATTTIPFRSSTSKLSSSAATSTEALNILGQDNLFINYISRIHREDDFEFILKGFTRLLNNPLHQSYLPNSAKRIQFHQELLVLFWKICDYNKKFMYYVLKTCDVLKILVPILYHLNDARGDRSRVGLVHIGVFIILLLSGERNFGVRLNRPYLATVPMDLPIFSGTHADLLVIVFHKLITTGHQRLQPLFDCLLTILVNVSPYLKTLSMVASAKVLHLLEAFSTQWFLFSNPTNHHLVFFLLEIFNNIIQYQFDGNSNLVYTIIRKRHIFHSLANLPTDYGSIQRSLSQAKAAVASVTAGTLPSSGSSASLGSSGSSAGGPVLRRSGSAKSAAAAAVAAQHQRHKQQQQQQQSRPLSLVESSTSSTSGRSSAGVSQSMYNDHHYHHSHVMMSTSSAKSTPVSPQSPNGGNPHGSSFGGGNFANFDSVITTTDLSHHTLQHQNAPPIPTESTSSTPSSSSAAVVAPMVKSLLEDEPLISTAEMTQNHHHHQHRSNVATDQMNVSLAALPRLDNMTERTHPNSRSILEEDEEDPEAEGMPVDAKLTASGGGGGGDNGFNRHHYIQSDGPMMELQMEEYQYRGETLTPLTDLIKRDTSKAGQRHPHLSRQSSSASERTTSASTSRASGALASASNTAGQTWAPTTEWIMSWKQKLPLQTIMRMLQVLVPQIEKMCLDKGITDENEILKFLQHGTLVGLLPVPHPILIRRYQTNIGTTIWFRTYMWGVIYLRNSDPPLWYDTNVKLFEIQKN